MISRWVRCAIKFGRLVGSVGQNQIFGKNIKLNITYYITSNSLSRRRLEHIIEHIIEVL